MRKLYQRDSHEQTLLGATDSLEEAIALKAGNSLFVLFEGAIAPRVSPIPNSGG